MIDTLIIYTPKEVEYRRTEHDCPKCHTNVQPVARKGGKYLCPECFHKAEINDWYKY